MNKLKTTLLNYPLMSSIIITLFSVGVLFLLRFNAPDSSGLFDLPRLFALAVISGAVCYVLHSYKWSKTSGLNVTFSQWHAKWKWMTLPLLLIALLSATSADWQAAEFSFSRVSAWLIANVATGFFEEVLMRGLCFFLLLNAWGATKRGVYFAAVTQALIFGVAHMANILHMPLLDVVAQVVFATLIGIGFAGLVYLSRSLWPAIFVHSAINSVGTVNDFLVPGYVETQGPGLAGYIVIVVIFLLLSTLPGLLYLRASSLREMVPA